MYAFPRFSIGIRFCRLPRNVLIVCHKLVAEVLGEILSTKVSHDFSFACLIAIRASLLASLKLFRALILSGPSIDTRRNALRYFLLFFIAASTCGHHQGTIFGPLLPLLRGMYFVAAISIHFANSLMSNLSPGRIVSEIAIS